MKGERMSQGAVIPGVNSAGIFRLKNLPEKPPPDSQKDHSGGRFGAKNKKRTIFMKKPIVNAI
jgi:hypothetical protein